MFIQKCLIISIQTSSFSFLPKALNLFLKVHNWMDYLNESIKDIIYFHHFNIYFVFHFENKHLPTIQ